MAVIGSLVAGLATANAIALTTKNVVEAAKGVQEVAERGYNDIKKAVNDMKGNKSNERRDYYQQNKFERKEKK